MKNIFTHILNSNIDRVTKAKGIANIICRLKDYSWVGLYDVSEDNIKIIACSGEQPAFPTFSREKGLNGRSVKNKAVVVVNDVHNDPDYLTTFNKTQSELIVPIILTNRNEVVGTIDIESHSKHAFQSLDVEFLTNCAEQIKPLWQ